MAAPLPLCDAPLRFDDAPPARGFVFVCRHCRRPHPVHRDAALYAWGVLGRVQEAGARLRCRNCGKRGLKGYLAPFRANMGSRPELSELVGRLYGLRPGGTVT